MREQKLFLLTALLALTAVFSACSHASSDMQDGYYSAMAADFDSFGWKEYVTIYVNDGQIVTVEYDAYNASGFTKSWDIDYMRTMNTVSGTYPNEYTRAYSISLINWQDPAEVNAISGATHSHVSFKKLSEAVIAKAVAGDKHVALVDLSD